MIATLLRRNISAWQLIAYAIACMTGLSILLTSLCFYSDLSSARSSASHSSSYLVLSKPVSFLAALGNSSPGNSNFSDAEINDLSNQPWVKRIGTFTPADFNISASVDFAGRGLSTALFFEAVPDEFIDIDRADWHFDSWDDKLPIIVPKDYLALYNFGFAASRGLPQISENLIKQIPLHVALSGNGHYDILEARIAGLSSRINTIAVPDSFMRMANSRYSSGAELTRPARLIVELNSPGDPAIQTWLDDNNIEASSDSLVSGHTLYLASLAASVIGVIGVVIAALSVMILLLSVFLLIQKNSGKIRDLTLLGYRRSVIASFYYKIILAINSGVTLVAVIIALSVSRLWTAPLSSIGADSSNRLIIVATALTVMAAVTAISLAACKKMIYKASR